MAIRGSLTEASLPDVLQLLAMGKKTGCLGLTFRQNFGFIYFDNGMICHSSIVNRGLGTEDSVYSLFTWTHGSFNFEAGVQPDANVQRVSVDPQSLLLEGARRVDEWSLVEKKITSFDLVFALDRQQLLFSKLELTAEQQTLLPLLDGHRDVEALVQASHMSEFVVGKALYGLINAGFLVPLGKSRPTEVTVPEGKVTEHRNLGIAFYNAGMLDEATREFRRVAELRPADPTGPFYLGLIALREQDWSSAAHSFQTAAPRSPTKMAIFHNLAYAYEKMGQLEKARLAMAQALARGGQFDPCVQTGAAALALRAGDTQDADLALSTARDLWADKVPPAAWFHYSALAAVQADDWPRAMKILVEGTLHFPLSATLLNNLAVAHAASGDHAGALSAAERGLMSDNATPQLYRNFGDALQKLGREEEASAAYRRASAWNG